MKSWQLAVVGLFCLVAAGCRTDPNIALLERELRLQEDEIYRLRGVVEEYQAALRSRGEDAGVRGRAKTVEPGGGAAAGLPRVEGVPSPAEGGRSLPGGAYDGRQSEAPPSPYKDSSRTPPGGNQPDFPGGDQPVEGPSDPKLPLPDPPDEGGMDQGAKVQPTSGTGPVLPGDSRHVSQLALDRLLTSGYDNDGRPGDDGIVVVIQPRDARGRAVAAPADVSVVLLDPAYQGEAGTERSLVRVARWDFTAAETAAHFRKAARDGGMQLVLPWPANPPRHSQLYLFVRYTTSDGRNLQVEGPIEIALPGQAGKRWVPAKPAASAPQASRPADLGQPAPTESHQLRPTPAVRRPTSLPPSPAAEPAGPKLKPPVWSPDRP
jgi:hypothetical protein